MKIAVYTIAKNEAKHVKRWADSCRDADYRIVADTGSTDDTVALLKAEGVTTRKIKVDPWRFDVARNKALTSVPSDADLCVTLDMDEILLPGWRAAIEAVWHSGATRLYHPYVWSFKPDGSPAIFFEKDRNHARTGYRWKLPVHEIIVPDKNLVEQIVHCPGCVIHHLPDQTKSRGHYLDLLRLAVTEAPDDDRSRHYLGRELFFTQKYEEAIESLWQHLGMRAATWAPERAASCRYIGESLVHLSRRSEAEAWYRRGTTEAPNERDPWYHLALFLQISGDHDGALAAAQQCIAVTGSGSYIQDSDAHGAGPYDIGSVSAWYLGRKSLARDMWVTALKLAPQDQRIAANGAFIDAVDLSPKPVIDVKTAAADPVRSSVPVVTGQRPVSRQKKRRP